MLDAKNLLNNVNANGIVGKMIGGMATKNFAAGLLTGGLAGGLLGRKGIGDVAETAAKVGGVALLGALAYKAYNNYQQTKVAGGTPSVIGSVKQSAQGMIGQAGSLVNNIKGNLTGQQQALEQPPAEAISQNPELSLAVIRAMIAAAKADGNMDDAEMNRIMQQASTADEKSFLMKEFANTADVNTIALAAKTPEEAAEIYLAALIVCDSQCANEQRFLQNLASALKLEKGFTDNLQQELLNANLNKAA